MLILYKPKSTVQLSILFQALHSVFSGDSKKTELQICTSTTTITDSHFKVIICNSYSIPAAAFQLAHCLKEAASASFPFSQIASDWLPQANKFKVQVGGASVLPARALRLRCSYYAYVPSLSVLVMSTELLAHLHICRLINQNNIFIAKI